MRTNPTRLRPARMWVTLLAVGVLVVPACAGESGETSTTATPTTTATTPPPSTTTQPTEPTTPLVLGSDGLGLSAFGADEDTVVDEVTAALGPPSEDSGWTSYSEIQPSFGICGGDEYRMVRWGQLGLLFTDGLHPETGEAVRHWAVYGYGGFDDAVGGDPDLATAEGVTVGDPVAEVMDVYGSRARFVPGDEAVGPIILVDEDTDYPMVFIVDGSVDAGTITSIRAGYICGE